MHRPVGSARAALRLVLLAYLASCTTDAPTEPLFRVAEVSVTGGPTDNVLVLATPVVLTAEAESDGGVPLSGRVTTWSSNNTGVATVNAAGQVLPIATGNVVITATVEGVSESRGFIVREGFAFPTAAGAPVTTTVLGGVASLTIPFGATPAGVTPHAAASTTTLTDNRYVIGSGVELGPNGTTFSSPVTLRLRYDSATITPAIERTQLRIHRIQGTSWVEVPGGYVDTVTNHVVADLNSFSTYAILRRGVPATLQIIGWTPPTVQNGSLVPGALTVLLRDAQARPVPRAVVRFAVSAGGGTIENGDSLVVTSATGHAALPASWRLGPGSGPGNVANSLSATVVDYPAVAAAVFGATGTPRPASLVVAEDSVAFFGGSTGANPPPDTVQISNGGQQTLAGLSAGPPIYVAGGGSGWLSTSFVGGDVTDSARLVLTPNIAGLKGGTYYAKVAVRSTTGGVVADTIGVSLTLGPAPAFALVIDSVPSGAFSGVTFGTAPRVRVLDAFGDVVAAATGAVSVAVDPACAGPSCWVSALTGTLSVNAVAGVARFSDLSLAGAGSVPLLFSYAGLTPITASVPVTQRLTRLNIDQLPPTGASGAPLAPAPVVSLVDDADLAVRGQTDLVTATVTEGTGTLAGTASVNLVDGVATFTDLRVVGTGPIRLTFTTAASADAPSVQSSILTIAPAPADSLALSVSPDGATSGLTLSQQPAVALIDALGNPADDDGVPVSVAVVAGNGTLLGTTTVLTVGGVASFTDLRIDGSGAQTLEFTSPGLASVSAGVVVAQTVASLHVLSQPTAGVVNAPLDAFVIEVRDLAGLVVDTATTAVHVDIPLGTAVPTGTTSVSAVAGVATFPAIVLDATGPHVLRFFSTSPALEVLAAELVVIAPPTAPSKLAIDAAPASATTGLLLAPITVSLRDAVSTLYPIDNVVVRVSVVGATALLAGTDSALTVDGVATFDQIVLSASGAHVLEFRSDGLDSVRTAPITLTPAFNDLEVTLQPTASISGQPFAPQPVVRLRDHAATTFASDTFAVLAQIESGPGAIIGGATAVTVAGVATFTDLGILGAGEHVLRFSTNGGASWTFSAPITVSPPPAVAAIVLTAISDSATSGLALAAPPTVELRDAGNAVLDVDGATVVAQLIAGTGELRGDTVATSVNGIATFPGLIIAGAGPHRLRFSYDTFADTSDTVHVTQQVAGLRFAQSPSGAVDRDRLAAPALVELIDHADLPVIGEGRTITVTSDPIGPLTGTTSVPTVGGIARFDDLVLSGTGSVTLRFAESVGSLELYSEPLPIAAATPGMLLKLSAGPTAFVAVSDTFDVPLILDLADRGSFDLASFDATVSWDPTRLDFVADSAVTWIDANGSGGVVVVNSDAAASGTVRLVGYSPAENLATFVARVLRFAALVDGPATLSVTITEFGDAAGIAVPRGPRHLTVTVSP